MLQPQQMQAFISLVDFKQHRVRHTTLLQSPNTKIEIGKMLVTWPKLEVHIVPSHRGPLQWLLVVIQLVDQRKCKFISVLFNFILSTNTELLELNSFESEIIGPTLSIYYSSPGLFLVEVGYCSKNK